MKNERWIVLILFVVLFILIAMNKNIKSVLSRGYRNNNPGNIRLTPELWNGEVKGKDKDFKTFRSMEYGYRALFIILRTYINNGINTIEKIVSVYAPSTENDTQGYIRSIERQTTIGRGELINFEDVDKIKNIVAAISYHENGIIPNIAEVDNGYKLLYT